MKKNKTVFIFWIILLFIFGLVFIFFVPPFQKPDEVAHYYRVASLAQGEFTCSTSGDSSGFSLKEKYFLLPQVYDTNRIAFNYEEKFDKDLLRNFDKSLNEQNENVEFTGFCSLPFIPYIPFTISFWLSELFNYIPISFYLSRIVAFTIFIVCVLLAFNNLKESKLKWVIVLYSLIPMVLHQASAVGYDYMQLALAPLIFSYVFRFLSEEKIKKKDMVLFFISSLLFVFVKAGYYFLPLIYFLIPYKKICKSKKKYLLITVGFLLSICAVALFMTLFFKSVNIFSQTDDVNAIEQLKNLFDIRFTLNLVKTTISTHMASYIKGFIGAFGWLDYTLSSYAYLLVFFIVFLLANYIQQEIIFNNYLKLFLSSSLILVGGIVFLFVSLYLTWNEVGATIISDVQGRYFLVYFPIMLIWLSSLIRGFNSNKIFRFSILSLALLLLLFDMVIVIFERYGGI